MILPKLTSGKTTLRRLKRSDAESIASNMSRRVQKFLGIEVDPYTAEDARKWINFTQCAARRDDEYHFGIQLPERSAAAGCIGLKKISLENKKAEVGYWLGEDYWNRGIISEALSLILFFAFDTLQLHRVYAMVDSGNPGSMRVLEKLGFTREGVLREAMAADESWRDDYIYGILESEWRGGNRSNFRKP